MPGTIASSMTRLIPCSLFLLGAAPMLAQQTPSSDPYTDEQPGLHNADYQAFLRANGGSWTSWWNRATGTPKAIFGAGIAIADWREPSLAEARRHANAVLEQYHDLLGLGVSEFREAIAAKMGNVFTFTWDQYFDGLPVLGGRADVRVNQCGRIACLGSVAWPIAPGFVTAPQIGALDATAIAWRALGIESAATAPRGLAQGKPRLVIWGDTDSPQLAPCFLAWEIPVRALDQNGNGVVGRSYVDAITGTVRHYTNDKHECGIDDREPRAAHGHASPEARAAAGAALPPATWTVMAYARDGVSSLTPATNVPLAGMQISVPGIGVVVTDQNGRFTATLAAPTQVTVTMDGIHNQLIAGGSAVTQTATLQPGVGGTIQVLGSGAADAQLAHTTCELWTYRVNEFARSILGNTSELASADTVQPTVNIAASCNAFYAGNSINFYAAGGGCTNTASSSVVAHEWGHGLDDRYGGISQVQGLSEGWGDIISEYLLDDPIIGDGFFGALGSGIRTGTNNTQYPPPAEVHAAGEVWMGFAWLARQNLRAAFGAATGTALANTLVIGSIAANAIDQPGAVLQVFLADDNDGNLTNGTPHYAQLEPACLAHNLPYPVIQVGTVSATPLADTTAQLTPRQVLATAVPNSGSFTSVTLVYNDGALHSRPMLQTGNANEYQALLPGLLAPTGITWHVEALHSTNVVKRAPSTGEFVYGVRAERRIYFEDFEHGAPGWTHGAIAGADDWEIAAPMGLGGPGWSDPPAAASGTNCAGTDLTVDGHYADAAETWLRSPPIDCSAFSSVRLRFQRWLTVDARGFDEAQIRIGGIPFWVNYETTPQVDFSWVTEDFTLPYAAGNPAVVIEFHLRTDASTTYGGWNIDDVELYTTAAAVPLAASLQILPEQAVHGAPLTVRLQTQGPQPFLLILGDTPGPTVIPGIPSLQVAGNAITLPGFSDAAGAFTLPCSAPDPVPLLGLTWYSQALTLDPNLQIVTTNQFRNLFTP